MLYEKTILTDEKVPVSAIAEYNWNLGSRCYLLNQAGLHPYRNTEEEITDFLEQSAKDKNALAICQESSRCSAFYKDFSKGKTPFSDKDPIKLLEYGGRYWVYEGKHRICMAKRSGVEYVHAQVQHLEEDFETLLPEVGIPGTYTFTAGRGTGVHAILWVEPPKGEYSPFSNGPRILNHFPGKPCSKTEIVPGVYVEISCGKGKRWFSKKRSARATVTIEPVHYNTAIWLYTIPVRKANSKIKPNTVFRCGRWREKHKFRIIPSSRYITD